MSSGGRVPGSHARAVTNTPSVWVTALHSHALIYSVLFSKWTHFLLSSDLGNENPRNHGSDTLMIRFILIDI